MSRAQLLYQLQSLDSEVDQAQEQLAEVETKLADNEALNKAKEVVEKVEQTLRQARATMNNLDLEVAGLVEKITRQEKMLYGGKPLSAKEAANLQDEVTSLKRWHSNREELLLEAMVEAEEVEEELNLAQAELSTVQEKWLVEQEKLKQKQNDLQRKIAELLERRPVNTNTIDEDDLNRYEALRPKKAGVAVVAVKQSVCPGCGMTASNSQIQRARAGTELVFCEGCGRILYVL